LYLGLVASLPAAPVNSEDDWVILALLGSIDIEGLALVLGFSVCDVTMHVRFLSESRDRKDQKSKEVSHCGQYP